MLAQAGEVARAIGSEYVVTYRPKRPLAEATPGEYRRIEVASRRVGLSLHARRGYVVPTPQTESSSAFVLCTWHFELTASNKALRTKDQSVPTIRD